MRASNATARRRPPNRREGLTRAPRRAVRVFDLDADGHLSPDEFKRVLTESIALAGLDASAVARVLAAPPSEGDEAIGMNYAQFRYFASLSGETVLATCGFMLHVASFYVPPMPFDSTDADDDGTLPTHGARKEQAPGDVPSPTPGAAPGTAETGVANPFEDEEFVAALESLRTTPEERALRCKERGNASMGKARGKEKEAMLHEAIDKYTEGLDEHGIDAVVNATLHSNRAAAHLTLRNWGRALSDVRDALALGALPRTAEIKACRRGAESALRLRKLADARELCELGLAVKEEAEAGAAAAAERAADAEAAGAAQARAAQASSNERAELRKVLTEVELAEEGVARVRRAEAAKKAEAAALRAALDERGVVVEDWADPAMAAMYVGEHSGARVWYDAHEDVVHWPVLLLYPEAAQSDFIQDFEEFGCLYDQLLVMFGEKAEHSPDWDVERKYAAPKLRPYVTFEADGGAERWQRLRADAPLLEQLVELQPLGYAIRGVPIIHVLVRGSAYEKELLRRLDARAL